jgi:glutathione reductase (NADPH)
MQSGKQVAIVEKDTIAGTCTNYGCNAKILLEGPYEVLEEAKQYPNIIDSHNLEVLYYLPLLYEHLQVYLSP